MSTSQQILNDVNLRYRNTFTTEQKLVWFNEEMRELFEVLEIDSPPYAFLTVEGENYYPFPQDFDTSKIKTVTFQNDDTPNPEFIEIDFFRNDDRVTTPSGPWYTIVSDSFYLYVPNKVPGNRTVYIFCDLEPTEVTLQNIHSPPDLPKKYHEILKLGILKRIAMARKDVKMYNNYTLDYEEKITNVLWDRKQKEPEWATVLDVQPKVGGCVGLIRN